MIPYNPDIEAAMKKRKDDYWKQRKEVPKPLPVGTVICSICERASSWRKRLGRPATEEEIKNKQPKEGWSFVLGSDNKLCERLLIESSPLIKTNQGMVHVSCGALAMAKPRKKK